MTDSIEVDIAIIGDSLGAVGAIEALTGRAYICVGPHRWIGGQLTAQGVSAPDEHAYIETFGAPEGYLRLRAAIRQTYIDQYGAPAMLPESVLGSDLPLNPGNGWVSRLCFLPIHALEHLPTGSSGWRAVEAVVKDDSVHSVTLENESGERLVVRARYFLDATDPGDLLPLTGTDYVTGAESHADTGEPHAPDSARPTESQGFTACFAVEYRPGEDHTIARPEGYEAFRHQYTLAPVGRDGHPVVYRMFESSPEGNLPFWSYRRLHDGALLGGNDIALINWTSNDYHGGDLNTATAGERARYTDEAKRLSLGFLYWLQTECPRDEGGVGYPELRLRPDVMGTKDGLAQSPYIRESRRIVPMRRIVEQDISVEYHAGARAQPMTDSVGIGWYAMDLHPCVGNPTANMYAPTRPFQIPLGALNPVRMRNLIPASKNIGTTHLTNGAYRLHPIEWAIGEAAGTLAAFCLDHELTPHDAAVDPWLMWRLQARLVRRGCPVYWAVDVPIGHPMFAATQLLLVRDLIVPDSPRWGRLDIGLDQPIGDNIHIDRLRAIADELQADIGRIDADILWAELCNRFTPALHALL